MTYTLIEDEGADKAEKVVDGILEEISLALIKKRWTYERAAREAGITKAAVQSVMCGNLPTVKTICRLAYALDCDVRFELVPKPIPCRNYTLPDELNADGTVKYKPLPNELNADGTVKNAVTRALTEPDLEARIEANERGEEA